MDNQERYYSLSLLKSLAYDDDVNGSCDGTIDFTVIDSIGGADVVKVVRCKDCKHGKSLDRTKPPFKYYKDCCVLCECEDVVGDEPMVYLPTHFCSYGERK